MLANGSLGLDVTVMRSAPARALRVARNTDLNLGGEDCSVAQRVSEAIDRMIRTNNITNVDELRSAEKRFWGKWKAPAV